MNNNYVQNTLYSIAYLKTVCEVTPGFETHKAHLEELERAVQSEVEKKKETEG